MRNMDILAKKVCEEKLFNKIVEKGIATKKEIYLVQCCCMNLDYKFSELDILNEILEARADYLTILEIMTDVEKEIKKEGVIND